jgi:phage terminase large subunit
MFKRTTAQAKIGKLRQRVRVVQGGTSSSKTFSIIPLLIQYAKDNPHSEISIVAESIPHLRRGAIRDFLKILESTGNLHAEWWNKSTLTYTLPNGSFIEFFSADQSDKLRGARRDILFVNEANNINWESYHQMSVRTRKFIYIDYNPTQEFWAHTELIGRDGTDFVILTYKDNEALEPAIVKEIEAARDKASESPYWANWWNVYGLGQTGSLQGVIFSNWNQCDKMPETWKWKAYGIDWGFTNDPTAVVEVCEFDGKLWINEILYEKGLTNADIADKLDGFRGQEFIADSAEPKSIEDIRRRGFRIRPCDKGRDSVRSGIDKLQQYPLMITSNSTNIIKEARGYTWATDRAGKETGEPISNMNHAWDAIRYTAMEKLKARSGQYSIR